MAIGATVLLAWASYVCVENPFRRGPLLHKVRPYAVIAGSLCCVFLAWRAADRVDRERYRLSLSVTEKNLEEWYPNLEPLAKGEILGNCGPRLRFESIGEEKVTVFDHGNCSPVEHVKTVFVTGNSHVVAYEPLLSRLARLEPYNVRLFYSGCPVLKLTVPMANQSPRCRRFYENVLLDVESRLPASVQRADPRRNESSKPAS